MNTFVQAALRGLVVVCGLSIAVSASPAAAQTIEAFAGGGAGDGGPATGAYARGIAGSYVDAQGAIYFAESDGDRVRRVGTDGVITTVAGNGVEGFAGDGGQATAAQLHGPGEVIKDASGNEATCAFNVTVRDTERPALLCPTNIVVSATAGRCDATVNYSPSVSDN